MKFLAIICLLLISTITCSVAQEKYVLLSVDSGTVVHKLGYSEADPGKEYMLVNVNVENHGYDEFKLDPSCFKMVVNKIVYDRDYLSSMAENGYPPLEDVGLEDGGVLSGWIAFTIPDGTTAYTLRYRQWSWDDYNIKWDE